MAIVWQNSFDGPTGQAVTVANSATYGDPVASVANVVTYSTAWAAHGPAALRLGHASGETGGEIQVDPASGTTWSLRAYLLIPSGGWQQINAITGSTTLLSMVDDDLADYRLLDQDVSAHTSNLVGRPLRLEIVRAGATATARVWWTDPDSTDAHDLQVQAAASGWSALTTIVVTGGGWNTTPSHIDEIAVGQGEWIGPVIEPIHAVGAAVGDLVLYGEADGRAQGAAPAVGEFVLYGEADGRMTIGSEAAGDLVLYGEADGFAGAGVATGAPIEDMWVGALGLLHPLAERGEWVRTPELGVTTHESLHGAVTVSRARRSARTTTLSWDRLAATDADALEEIALIPARADAAIAVIDPDAATGNLLAPEQSRGRPGPGSAPGAVEHLYQVTGSGRVTVGTVGGVRQALIDSAESGTAVRWLHPYWGTRGWPVMPGWPVYLSADITGGALASLGRLWLTFHDFAGAVITSAAGLLGDGQCEADAPPGAVSVSPQLIISEPAPGLRLLGAARMSYAPHTEGTRPLGNGCPAYAVTDFSDTPVYPYRSLSLNLQEVRAIAYR